VAECGAWLILLLSLAGTLVPVNTASAQETSFQASPSEDTSFFLHQIVRQAKAQNYAILIGRERVDASQGDLQAARGAFDFGMNASVATSRDNTLFTELQRRSFQVPSAESGRSTYRVGISKRFRSDVIVTPSLDVARTDAFTLESAPVLRTGANLNIAIPLLRKSGAADSENAARRLLSANELALRFTHDQSVQRAASAYWSYRAAYLSLTIYQKAEALARQLLNETRALVEHDERPAADLDQLRANLSDITAQRVAAQQRLFEVRQQLANVIGVPPDEASRLVVPKTPFPRPASATAVPPSSMLEAEALRRRADLQEAEARVAAADYFLDATRRVARPRFDLQLDLGYAGLSEGRLGAGEYAPPLGQNQISGASASVTLVYDWSVGNNDARGGVIRQHALRQQRLQDAEEIRRQIRFGVSVAADQLRSFAVELGSAGEAVRLYQKAVTSERKKLRLGMSTLFDVTTVTDRLTRAQLNEVSAQARYAQALARLRLETGTLRAETSSADAIANALISPPTHLSFPAGGTTK